MRAQKIAKSGNYMETAQTLTMDMDIEEAAMNAPMSLNQADDCGIRLDEIKADATGILQIWKERRNALTNEECEARVMVREYGDMLVTARAAKLGLKNDAYFAAKWLQYTTKEEWLSILPAFGFAVEMREKHQARIEELNAEIAEIAEAQEYLSEYLTGATPSVSPASASDDLPFESAQAWRNPSSTRISQFEFSRAVNSLLFKKDVLAGIEQYCQLDAAQLAANLRENSPTYKSHVKSALESAIYDNAQDEQTADALTDAVNVYFDSVVEDIEEALEEFAAPMPSQRRINANIGYRA